MCSYDNSFSIIDGSDLFNRLDVSFLHHRERLAALFMPLLIAPALVYHILKADADSAVAFLSALAFTKSFIGSYLHTEILCCACNSIQAALIRTAIESIYLHIFQCIKHQLSITQALICKRSCPVISMAMHRLSVSDKYDPSHSFYSLLSPERFF